MKSDIEEVERRKKAAISAIENAFGTEEDQFGVTLFVSHHLENVEGAYWQEHLGTPEPEPKRVLDILVFQSHWGDEDENGIDTFDFTLPRDVTNYIISVRFDEMGDVEEIVMES